MDLMTRDDIEALLVERQAPCVSIFMPTHRGGAEADPIRWRVQVDKAEKLLSARGMRTPAAKELLAPARQLLEDATFWNNQGDGLACFLSSRFLRLYRLPRTFADLVVVGKRFQITPLLSLFTGARFYVLALSQNGVRLLQGTPQTVSEVDLKGVPRNLAEALLAHDSDEPLTFHSRPVGGIGSWGAIFSGHGVGIDDEKDDLLRYFQKIDRGLHPILRQERAPLVLAAVPYFIPIYRKASAYPHLVERAIEGNPDHLSSQELHDRAWSLVRPAFQEGQYRAIAQYQQLAGTGRTASRLDEILSAASEGQVETLLLAQDQQRWGRFDPLTGQVEEHEPAEPDDEDLLNLAAFHTLTHGKTVYVLDQAQMPEGADLAATFCLPLAKRGKRP